MSKTWGILLIAAMTACRSKPPSPVDIESYDMCSVCRMAISQKQFAAEIIDESGTAHKFDDIGCMLRFRKQHPEMTPAATFVVDYGSRQWLNADTAVFVHSETIQTPMSGGFVAFADESHTAEGRPMKLVDILARQGGRP